MVTTFADQAVIAIENARLFEAEQQRTRELTESLEQQTATAEVLQVISSSPGDLKPVFETMLANAAQHLRAKFGSLACGMVMPYRIVASTMRRKRLPNSAGEPLLRSPNNTLGRMIATKAAVQVADIAVDAELTLKAIR